MNSFDKSVTLLFVILFHFLLSLSSSLVLLHLLLAEKDSTNSLTAVGEDKRAH